MKNNTAKNISDAFDKASEAATANGALRKLLFIGCFDVSGSVENYIASIKTAIKTTIRDLKADATSRAKVWVLWVFFGVYAARGENGVSVIGPKPLEEVTEEEIDDVLKKCGYSTPGCTALQIARNHRKELQLMWVQENVDFDVPIQFVCSDFCFNPNDSFAAAWNELLEDRKQGKIILQPIVTHNKYDEGKVSELFPDGKMNMLEEQNAEGYTKLFSYIKESVRLISHKVGPSTETRMPDMSKYGIKPIVIKLNTRKGGHTA